MPDNAPKFKFDRYICIGDMSTIEIDGITYAARIEADTDTQVDDFDCYNEEQVAAWKRDEWHFVGVVISARVAGLEILGHAASLWGVDCNFPGSDNSYIAETANNELLPEAIEAAKARVVELREKLAQVKA